LLVSGSAVIVALFVHRTLAKTTIYYL